MHATLSPARLARLPLIIATMIVLALFGSTAVLSTPAARAASHGVGFGTWSPLSSTGWFGSATVGDLQTYCIVPGLPVPTGESSDLGVRGDVRGFTPHQLTGINRLVSAYGQTGDPVQAAAVGWAVKALSDHAATLSGWGYRGTSLGEAVRWSLDRIAPSASVRVAELAEAYYAEASAVTVPATDGRVVLSTDPDDPSSGSVRVEGGAGTSVALRLENAVFADSGSPERSDVAPGAELAITVTPTLDGSGVVARAFATFRAPYAPLVRHISTPGQQDTAGPGGPLEYTAEATDAAARPAVFAPVITTQVASNEASDGPFVDDVTISSADGRPWPRDADGRFVPIAASATVYRTQGATADVSADVPVSAEAVGELHLVTDPELGPGTYRVASEWNLPGPGTYTAVWQVDAAAQSESVRAHLGRDFRWVERFGVPAQTLTVPAPPSTPTPTPSVPVTTDSPPPVVALAATGPWSDAPRVLGAGSAALLLGAAILAHLAARRRRDARV